MKEVNRDVLFLVPQPFLIYRGSPFRVKATVSALGQLGYNVDLLVYHLGEDVELPNVRIIRSFKVPFIKHLEIGFSWPKVLLDLLLFIKAANQVRKKKYAVIHAVEETVFCARILSRIYGIPYIYDMHSRIPEQFAYNTAAKDHCFVRFAECFERYYIKGAAVVITVADKITNLAKRIKPGIPAYTLQDLPLSSTQEYTAQDVDNLRTEFGLKPTERVIVYTGNLETYQGIELLLRSMRVLVTERGVSDLKLLLVGGLVGDVQYVKMKALCRELALDSNVIFTGSRPPEEMDAFMALADVLVSTRTEGCNTPLKVYGYMLSGKPIVATKIVSHTQVLTAEYSFLAEPEPLAFARAMNDCLEMIKTNPQEIAQRTQKAREVVESKYSVEDFSNILRKAYERVTLSAVAFLNDDLIIDFLDRALF